MKKADINEFNPLQVEELREIELYISYGENGKLIINGEKGLLEEGKYVKHSVWFKVPNYQDSTFILSGIYKNSKNLENIDPVQASLLRVSRLVKKWTFKDVECTSENINKLNTDIGMFIGSEIGKILDTE